MTHFKTNEFLYSTAKYVLKNYTKSCTYKYKTVLKDLLNCNEANSIFRFMLCLNKASFMNFAYSSTKKIKNYKAKNFITRGTTSQRMGSISFSF